MAQHYDHTAVEEKWLQSWEEQRLFQDTADRSDSDREKMYLLFAFAYPSGSGLHVGHVESKTALDIMARFYRMSGKDVFFPVGWDAFGLPAENYAIKTGVPPAETTIQAINTFRRQIKRLAISYDWANEIATSHPEYYKWTQWIFLQLFNKNLAYKKNGRVNWCPSCQTVLANEQVVNGACERCGTEVIQKDLEQWFYKITEYTEELISGLDQVDWPHATKQQQLNWIGKKEGLNITYPLTNWEGKEVVCFTTRPDTNFGATFVVLGPEHPLISEMQGQVDAEKWQEIEQYCETAINKKEIERLAEGKKKTGVFTGFYCTNRLNGSELPIYISDFVLGNVGTGAVVGVPGHDVRDFQFAQAMDLPVIRVVAVDGDTSEITSVEQVQEDAGTMVNSKFLDGMEIIAAKEKMMDYHEEQGFGERVTTYKLRDWLISRQRYWGAPIPIVYDPDGNPHPVKEEHLPWMLPTDVDFNPDGKSPLRSSKEFQERVEKLYGKGWTPEYDTMDTFVDSSWYFMRYTDSRNSDAFARKDRLESWLPVDFYMIGPEHIVLHLLYSRFFTKFLRDAGYLNFDEPFSKMRHQGMILGPDHRKMSKSKGNVINPDEIIEKFGADTLRMYEMFMGPIEADKPWDVRAVAGMYRFLQRVNKIITQNDWSEDVSPEKTESVIKLHQTIKKVTQDIPALKYNTAIAALMELMNVWEKDQQLAQHISKADAVAFIKLLAPFAPFLAEELHHAVTGSSESVHLQGWPQYQEQLAEEESVVLAVQVNGKVRAEVSIAKADREDKEKVLAAAKEIPAIQKWLEGKTIRKEIYVPGRIINIVVWAPGVERLSSAKSLSS